MLNEIDAKLHEAIHRSMMEQDPASIFKDRVDVFKLFEDRFGPIHGKIADIGCGNGYAGIWLALNSPKVERVDAIEASSKAVNELIPRNISYHNVENLVMAKQGSFDDLGADSYDFVVAFGALHHSTDLQQTFDSVFRSLKAGGYLIAQEPAMPDDTSHIDYEKKYNIVEEKFGLKIRNGDRHDHFFRECEYKCAAVHAGFDIVKWTDFAPSKRLAIINIPPIRFLVRFLRVSKGKGLKYAAARSWSHLVDMIGGDGSHNQADDGDNGVRAMQKATARVQPKILIARKSSVLRHFHRT